MLPFFFIFLFSVNLSLSLTSNSYSTLYLTRSELKRTTSNGRSVGMLKLEGLCKREVEENLILKEGLKT
ncbi:hypothetical protein Lalb_Chr24g0398771 [Lupinus albus]|uniref:Secreted protein n=1 Tax=Lupinus albus TaxID=3870 RepID=A0A6A4N3V9_LUPAL|nr:hypothetical protein Lalb_Chr24g0398771 [Lupinus albus]